MPAESNPYYIAPPDIYSALMAGQQGYNFGSKIQTENDLKAARAAAAAALRSGGDIRNPLATLIGAGANPEANTIASFGHSQAQEKLAAATLANTIQHQGQTLDLQNRQLANTQQHQNADLGLRRDVFEENKSQNQVKDLQPVKIGQDNFGGDIYAIRDPKSPSGFRVINARETAPQNLSSQNITGIEYGPTQTNAPQQVAAAAPQAPATGEDYLKTVDPAYQALIKKIANYEVNPASLSTRGGHRERVLAAVSQFDPTYDQAQYPMRSNALTRFTSGPQGNTIRSLNVIVDHANTLRELGDALQNGNIQLFNKVAQSWAQQTGAPAPTNFDMAKQIVGSELIKALGVAGAGTEKERGELGTILSRASSPAQINGAIDQVVKPLLGGQLRGLRSQFTAATKLPDSRFNDMLFPGTRKFLGDETGTQTAATTSSNIPGPAIEALKSNPKLRNAFDAKYGAGSAAKALGE